MCADVSIIFFLNMFISAWPLNPLSVSLHKAPFNMQLNEIIGWMIIILIPLAIINGFFMAIMSLRRKKLAKRASLDRVMNYNYTSVPVITRRSSPIRYLAHRNPGRIYVYMLFNPFLKAIKIGVGTYGRIEQHMSSVNSPNEDGTSVGWTLLRLGEFSSRAQFDEIERANALAAEAAVLRYWKRGLDLQPHLNKEQMGYSRMNVHGTEDWVYTKGWSETVSADKVCEVTSWKLVQNSLGFKEEVEEVQYSRELIYRENLALEKGELFSYINFESITTKLEDEEATNKIRPIGIGETNEQRFWKHVERGAEDECWNWLGTLSQKGYPIYIWDGKSSPSHRIMRHLMGLAEYQAKLTYNHCGKRDCINPQHWGPKQQNIFKCLTPGCENDCSTTTKSTFCEKCKSRKRRGKPL